MVEIKYRFTCDDSDLSEIIKKYQNIMTSIVDLHMKDGEISVRNY